MKKDIEHIVEKTLQSLDGMERADANPFLYGKVMARMLPDTDVIYRKKLVFRYAVMIVLAVSLNTFTLVSYLSLNKKHQHTDYKEGISALTKEYFNHAGENSY